MILALRKSQISRMISEHRSHMRFARLCRPQFSRRGISIDHLTGEVYSSGGAKGTSKQRPQARSATRKQVCFIYQKNNYIRILLKEEARLSTTWAEERRSEKCKGEKRRSRCIKRRRVRKHCLFPMFCGFRGPKSGLTRAAGA